MPGYVCRCLSGLLSDGGSTPPASTRLRSQRSEERSLPRRSLEGEAGLPLLSYDSMLRTTPWQALPRRSLEGEAGRKEMQGFHYVYILSSEAEPFRRYTGLTEDLESRLKAHNSGQVPHTSKNRPWEIETAVAFKCRKKAIAFEKYLKTHSGRAFASKHF